MVNLKQHQFSWGRRVPLSWREIGKSNFRLLCWEFHHGHLTDPSFFTQIFLPVVKMEWHLVMGREDDGCWNPYWGYRMIQVERIKNSSRRSRVLLQRGQELCLFHQEQSHLKRLKLPVTKLAPNSSYHICIRTSAPNLAVGVWHWGIQEWSALRRETRWQNVTSRTWSRCVALHRACAQGRKARRSEAKAATLSWE